MPIINESADTSTITAPTNIDQLKSRVDSIAGHTLATLAHSINVNVPEDLRREKGWVGQLIEKLLGATAGNKPEPDFVNLGIELKTIPVNSKGNPTESTYVCVVPLSNIKGLHWQNSIVKQKLQTVLWVPIEADKNIMLKDRRVGQGIFWQPDEKISAQLEKDYNEFIDRIALGQVEKITADQGNILQIRPKAANASVLTEGIGEEGQMIRTLPRGFYLRPAITKQIISDWRDNLLE